MGPLRPQLVQLPHELLLEILGYLSPNSRASRAILSLSLVNHQLRQLCLPLLFSHLRCQNSATFQRLHDKSVSDPFFVKLIRTLDLTKLARAPCENLDQIIPRLQCLSYILIHSSKISEQLLTTMNHHPTLRTVQISDSDERLKLLARFPSAAPSLFSKVSIDSAALDDTELYRLVRSPTMHLFHAGGLRINQLQLRGKETLEQGPGGLHFRGLEVLKLGLALGSESLTWLPAFVQSQPDLTRIEFRDTSAPWCWCSNIHLRHGAQVRAALIAEGFQKAISMKGWSISRTPAAKSLDDWEVTALDLHLNSSFVDVLSMVHEFYPNVSSLVLKFRENIRKKLSSIHMDDFIDSLAQFRTLRSVRLVNPRNHLHFDDEKPWAKSSQTVRKRKPSGCDEASAAMRWFFTRLVQRVPSIVRLSLDDIGGDWDDPTETGPPYLWGLEASYRVGDGPGGRKLVGKARLCPS
ncbi:hypothetical protein C8J56DRAFT_1059493 [Mycena floridula]|nr:hypothetical protein C8J56DRAFT_1059493 [Mycena floridula]